MGMTTINPATYTHDTFLNLPWIIGRYCYENPGSGRIRVRVSPSTIRRLCATSAPRDLFNILWWYSVECSNLELHLDPTVKIHTWIVENADKAAG